MPVRRSRTLNSAYFDAGSGPASLRVDADLYLGSVGRLAVAYVQSRGSAAGAVSGPGFALLAESALGSGGLRLSVLVGTGVADNAPYTFTASSGEIAGITLEFYQDAEAAVQAALSASSGLGVPELPLAAFAQDVDWMVWALGPDSYARAIVVPPGPLSYQATAYTTHGLAVGQVTRLVGGVVYPPDRPYGPYPFTGSDPMHWAGGLVGLRSASPPIPYALGVGQVGWARLNAAPYVYTHSQTDPAGFTGVLLLVKALSGVNAPASFAVTSAGWQSVGDGLKAVWLDGAQPYQPGVEFSAPAGTALLVAEYSLDATQRVLGNGYDGTGGSGTAFAPPDLGICYGGVTVLNAYSLLRPSSARLDLNRNLTAGGYEASAQLESLSADGLSAEDLVVTARDLVGGSSPGAIPRDGVGYGVSATKHAALALLIGRDLPLPDITAPVRVSLSEDTSGLFDDARISVTNLPTKPVAFGSTQSIASEIRTGEPYYTYLVSQLSADKDGLQTHTGETVVGLLARLEPKDGLFKAAPSPPGYWWPEEALTVILQAWAAEFPQLRFNPVPPMYVQTAGGLYRPKVYALALAQPTPAQLASGTKPKTCKQFLDDFFKVFSGYHFRADADNKLTVVRPWWAYDAPSPPAVVTPDQVGLEVTANEDIKSIVNACTVKSALYSFAAGGAVCSPGSLCIADPYWGPYAPASPATNPSLSTPAVRYNLSSVALDPFTAGVVVAPGSPLTLNVGMHALVAQIGYPGGSTDGYPNTLTLTLGNGTTVASKTVLYYAGGALGRGSAYIAVDVYAYLDGGSLYVGINAPSLYATDAFGNGFAWVVAADFSVLGSTYTKTKDVYASFGLAASDLAAVPGVGASQSAYGVLRQDVDSGLISLDEATALQIARGIVERGYNPYYVYEYNQMPPYPIRPDALGQRFQFPGGVIGELAAWDYREDNATPSATHQTSSSRVKVKVLGSSLPSSAGFAGSAYGSRAVYGKSPYVQAGVGAPNPGGGLTPPGAAGGTPSTGPRLLWELRSADEDSDYTSGLTPALIAAINAKPFDGVSLEVSGFTLECCRPGYAFNPSAFAAELDKAAAITKRKRAIVRASGPSDPKLDPAAWDRWIALMAQAAGILRQKGWDGFDYDPEPYQTLSGGPLVYGSSEVAAQSAAYGVPITGNASSWNATDFGWWFLFRDPSYRPLLQGIFRRYANALSNAYPGIYHGWYHGAAAGDGSAPGSVTANQAGNGHLALGYALQGMMQAICLDGAALVPEDMNEDFGGNDLDWGAGWAATSVAYRKTATPLASGLSRWGSAQAFGHMRMRGKARSDPAGLAATLPALWASLSPASGGYARISFYHNNGDDWTAAELQAIAQVKATL